MPDSESFSRLYKEHVWSVYAFIGYRVGSRDEAEDLTQQTFEHALGAWQRFEGDGRSERNWLLTIARNCVIDKTRRESGARTVSWYEEVNAEDDQTATSHCHHQPAPRPSLGLAPELELALRRLSGRAREVIALRFGGDLTGREIADITGLSISNVQQILSRSLRRLATELEGVEEL